MTDPNAQYAQRLFELSLDLLIVVDPELHVVGASPSWERLLGYKPEEVVGRRLQEMTFQADFAKTARAAEELRRGASIVTIENRVAAADGSARWIRWTGRADPQTQLIYAVGHDITAEVEAAAAADAAVARLEAAQRVARMGSFEFDLRTREVFYTAEMYRLMGVDPEREKPFWIDEVNERVVPDDRERVTEMLNVALNTGGPITGDVRMAHDPECVLYATMEVERDAGGRPVVGRGTVQDVTALRAAEAERRRSERRLEEAERIAGVGAVDYSVDDNTMEWSAGMYRIYGIPSTDPPLSVADFLARMRPDEAAQCRTAVERAAATLSSYEADFHMIDARGRLRAFTTRGEAYRERGTVRIRASVQDVTRVRRQSEQQVEIARLGELALGGRDRDALFREVCAAISRTLQTPLSSIVERRPDDTLVLAAGIGWPPDSPPIGVYPGQQSVVRAAMESGEPVIVDDWHTERRFPYSPPLRNAGVRSTAVLCIGERTRPFGVLATHTHEPGVLERDDIAFLEALAALLATAIERFRFEEEIAELAAVRGRLVAEALAAEERVRRTISEDLHDHVLQDLLAARQDLVEAEQQEPGAGEMVASARSGVERAVARLRDAVHALHPVVLEHGGLHAALQAAAEQAARVGGFRADVAVAADAAGLRDDLVLSVARELLTNAAKHAKAEHVHVTVWRTEDEVVLEVDDDGLGVDQQAVASAPLRGHIGLAAVAQRVEATGGSFDLGPIPGRPGTIVRATIPVA